MPRTIAQYLDKFVKLHSSACTTLPSSAALLLKRAESYQSDDTTPRQYEHSVEHAN